MSVHVFTKLYTTHAHTKRLYLQCVFYVTQDGDLLDFTTVTSLMSKLRVLCICGCKVQNEADMFNSIAHHCTQLQGFAYNTP
jgi:hypothetical protein